MAKTPALAAVYGVATRATSLFDPLRSDLLGGVLEPGSKLAIEAPAGGYATSATRVDRLAHPRVGRGALAGAPRLARTPRSLSSDRKSEHQQLMVAAIAGHADEAAALLRAHFERTAKIIRDDHELFASRAA